MKIPSTAALQSAIAEAARKVFTELRAAHAKETFYAFALYTNTEASSISATANTEEGLIRRAREYEAREKRGLQEHARTLRWNPADWAYHCAGEEHFEEAQDILDARPGDLDDDDDNDKEIEARLAAFIAALKSLDKEGLFGRGKAREGVVLLVMMGDQEIKLLLRCAQQLNPSKVYKRFSEPFLRTDAGRFKGLGSRKVYETVGVAVSRNGKVLAAAGDEYLFAFSLPAKREILKLKVDSLLGLRAPTLSPDGALVAAGWQNLQDETGGIRCWDIASRKTVWDIGGQESGIVSVDFSPDGASLASASEDGIICIRDARNGEPVRKLSGQMDWLQCVRFSPDGRILASSDRRKGVWLWDAQSGKRTGEIAEPGDYLAFSLDGKWLAVASGFAEKERVASIWDVTRRKLVKRLQAVAKSRFQVVSGPDDYEDCQVSGVAFSPDGNLLAVERSWPGSVVLWDWKQERELLWMNPNYECLGGVVFLPDGKTVAVAGRSMDGPPLLLWDVSKALK
ncbi:MAG: DUF4303 domain-containing protein [Verrucomicrobiota bacterium]